MSLYPSVPRPQGVATAAGGRVCPAPAAPGRLLLKGGYLVDPKNGREGPFDLALEGDRVAEAAPHIDPRPGDRVVDCRGLLVLPGLIDMHLHMGDLFEVSTARDLLLVDDVQLVAIDALLCELEDEEFVALLPQLRLAFSYFTPTETDRLGRQAAALHGEERLKAGSIVVSPTDYTCWEAIDAWAAQRLEQWEPDRDEEGDDQA